MTRESYMVKHLTISSCLFIAVENLLFFYRCQNVVCLPINNDKSAQTYSERFILILQIKHTLNLTLYDNFSLCLVLCKCDRRKVPNLSCFYRKKLCKMLMKWEFITKCKHYFWNYFYGY